jgi:GNAT superfamily N-acetyltransferase
VIRLEPLAEADLPEVMRIERLPGYGDFVHPWGRAQHDAELASPDARYFGVRTGPGLAGFAILQDVRQPQVRLRRIAVGAPGGGTGTRLLRAVMDWTFGETAAEALWLHVAAENARARHVYEREGFAPVGRDDELHDRMRITRAQWKALRGAS